MSEWVCERRVADQVSSDHMEGEALIAEKQAHFADDGVIDKQEQKEIDKAHKRQLESRGRGLGQLQAYRTGKWALKVGLRLPLPQCFPPPFPPFPCSGLRLCLIG